MKFVISGGYGLDEVALDYAFTFKFHPALDEHNQPVESNASCGRWNGRLTGARR